MRLIRPLAVAALALGGLLAASSNADANFTVTIKDPSNATIYNKSVPVGSTFSDSPGTGAPAGFLSIVGISTNTPTTSGYALILLVNTGATGPGAAAGNYTVTMTEDPTDFTGRGKFLGSSINPDSGIIGGGASNITYTTSLTGPATGSTSLGPVSAPATPTQVVNANIPTVPYGMTSTFAFTLPTNSLVSIGASSLVTPSPAPSTVILVLAGLPLLGFARFRRKVTEAAA